MSRYPRLMQRLFAGAVVLAALAFSATAFGQSPTPNDLYYESAFSFSKTNGANPQGTVLVSDGVGNYYGTTTAGGATDSGTVFKITAEGAETVLYNFTGGADGRVPIGSVVLDSAGDIFGTALDGGSIICGCGTVWEIPAGGKFKVLYTFTGKTDGGSPLAGLAMDPTGNLYGTTEEGGSDITDCGTSGCGTVYKVTPAGTESVIYSFTGYQNNDGYNPQAPVVLDKAGNIYGTTFQGGAESCICGTIFMLTPAGKETVLHSFNGTDGNGPTMSSLAMDSRGNLFGVADSGGSGASGTVYEYSATSGFILLYTFTGGSDGENPFGGVVLDSDGNLYGTTDSNNFYAGHGLIYKLTPSGTETVLHDFTGTDGGGPYANPILVGNNLVGTTLVGGTSSACGAYGCGTIYKLSLIPRQVASVTFTIPSQVNYGANLTLSANVSGEGATPTGTVQFASGGTIIATLPLTNGSASTAIAANVPPGTYPVTASYSGDPNYQPYTANPVNVTVEKQATTTGLVINPSSFAQGATVTLSVSVKAMGSRTPTGSVLLSANGQRLGSITLGANGSGSVQVNSANYPKGTYTVTATYQGDQYNAASSGTATATSN